MKNKRHLTIIGILAILCGIYSVAALSIGVGNKKVDSQAEVQITPIPPPDELLFDTYPNDEYVEAVGWFLTSNNTINGTVGELEVWWRNKDRNINQLVPYRTYLEFIKSKNKRGYYNVKIRGVYGEKITDGKG